MKWKLIGVLMIFLALGAGCGRPSSVSPVESSPVEQKMETERKVEIEKQTQADPVLKTREEEALKMRLAIKMGKIEKVGQVESRVSSAQGSVRIVKTPQGLVLAMSDDFSVVTSEPITVKLSRYSNPGNSAEVEARGSLSLGILHYNTGGQTLTIPAGTDTSQFRSVVLYSPTVKAIFALAMFE